MANLVFVRFFPKSGHEDRVERILRVMVEATRCEPGNEIYDLFHSTTSEGTRLFGLIERYRDQDALGAHRATEHYKAYRAGIMEHLSAPIEVTVLEALDVRALQR